jgi:cell division protein FtsQ
MGVVGVLAALLAVAVYSPLLALRTIRIEGSSAVSAEEVSAAIDGQLGTPLALLDYNRIRAELDGFPLIRSFVTEVLPPSTLVVKIVERAPVGTIATAAGFAVVDPAGVHLSTSPQRVPGVPLIDVGSKGADSTAFHSVVEVLLALPDAIRVRVDTARATSKDDVTLVLAGVGQRVVWGSADRSALKARVLEDLMATQGENAKVEFDVSAPLSPVVRPG